MKNKWLVWAGSGVVLYVLELKVMWLLYLMSTKLSAIGLILNPWDKITWWRKYLEFFPAILLNEHLSASPWLLFVVNSIVWAIIFITIQQLWDKRYGLKKN